MTAGNASPVTDGAAAMVLASYEAASRLNLPILGVIRGQADANQAPEWFTTTPALAAPKVGWGGVCVVAGRDGCAQGGAWV